MNRRDAFKSASSLLAASALVTRPANALETDRCGRVAKPATFVLVPGAWCGGFVYDAVAAILHTRGHRVLTPTLTGLGERSHLLGPDINLTTHITDIENVIRFEELSDVVLAGHSYGGVPITGAADRMADRISSIVYLDAVLPENGQTVQELSRRSDKAPPPPSGSSYALPMPQAFMEEFGIPESERWRYTPSPTGVGTEPIKLTGAYKSIGKKTYVLATQWDSPMKRFLDKAKADPSWTTVEIASGHMLMLDAPQRTAEILEDAI